MANIALSIHQAFASNLAFENQVLWDEYTPRQFSLFKEKLNEFYRNSGDQSSSQNKTMEKVREAVYKSTIAQTKYTNRNLLSTFILVTVAEGTTFIQARDATKFSVHLIVRTRKCMKDDDSSNCCMIFIDEHGRVYKNWKSFIDDNLLPKGVAFAPFNGVYTYDGVQLSMESWETPSSKLARKVIATTDVAVGMGGFAAAGVSLAAIAMPVSAPVVAVAGAMAVSTGIYSAIRSGWQLKTRCDHEQSIALTNREARGCWLGVTSGALAVTSSVASRSLASVALAGREVSLLRETVVNGMNISTMLISGTGVANGIMDVILKLSDDERITKADWLKVTASLVIFTHSAYNFRLASRIVSSAQNSRASTYKTELSSRLKELFSKMTRGTFCAQRMPSGKMDLIRLTNEVPDNLSTSTTNSETEFLPDLSSSVIWFYENFQDIMRVVEPIVLNKDSFQSCVLYLMKNLGEQITIFLMEKAKDLVDEFRDIIEAFIRTTVCYEAVLWDLYKKCEEHLVTLTLRNLEDKMSIIFRLLLSHYEEMSCHNVEGNAIACQTCNGYYKICSIE